MSQTELTTSKFQRRNSSKCLNWEKFHLNAPNGTNFIQDKFYRDIFVPTGLKLTFKQQREQKRALADKNKVLFSFYADLEEHYAPLCPDLFLIKDNAQARRFKSFKLTYSPSE